MRFRMEGTVPKNTIVVNVILYTHEDNINECIPYGFICTCVVRPKISTVIHLMVSIKLVGLSLFFQNE